MRRPAAQNPHRRLGLTFNRRTLIAAAAAIAIVAGGAFGTEWWVSGRYVISTDDAYVRAHNTTLASKISGYVASIPIEDNATIHAGDVIATIDDGDYKLPPTRRGKRSPPSKPPSTASAGR